MQELLAIMRRLRAPGGCPWDREQTHQTLRPYLLEEAAEAADAISAGEWHELPGELGDVLLQVAFHSVIAEEAGTFGYAEVERNIVEKLVRRHPHVFGSTEVSGSAEVLSNWQAIKVQERSGRERSLAEQIPSALGALAREAQAQKLTKQAKGTRQEVAAALKLSQDHPGDSEGAAVSEQEIGALLVAVVAYARAAGIDPEVALRAETNRALANQTLAEQDPTIAPAKPASGEDS